MSAALSPRCDARLIAEHRQYLPEDLAQLLVYEGM
jgi:hypothetical protein